MSSIENNHQQVEKMHKGSQCAIQIVCEGNANMTYAFAALVLDAHRVIHLFLVRLTG